MSTVTGFDGLIRSTNVRRGTPRSMILVNVTPGAISFFLTIGPRRSSAPLARVGAVKNARATTRATAVSRTTEPRRLSFTAAFYGGGTSNTPIDVPTAAVGLSGQRRYDSMRDEGRFRCDDDPECSLARARSRPTPSPPHRSWGVRRPGTPVTPRIFGVRLDDVASERQLRELLEQFLDGDRACRIFTPNPEILLRARNDPAYKEVLNSADLSLPDGTGVAVVQSLRARRRVRRWPGVEIGGMLLRIAAERGATVAFLGGSHGAAERAADRWRRALPGLRIDIVGAGAAVAEDGVARTPEVDADLTGAIGAMRATIVLVGLGAPKQERWIARNADAVSSARIMIGVGGAFDMWAERMRRAPRWLRRLGLEWAWRLALEPQSPAPGIPRHGRLSRAGAVGARRLSSRVRPGSASPNGHRR